MRLAKVYPKVQRRRRLTRRGRAGFSILEALVAAGVLGIGLIALVKLHTATMRGMKSSNDLSSAAEIATQLAEEVATQPYQTAPICTQVIAPDLGCKQGTSPVGTQFNPTVKPCTAFFPGSAMRTPGGALPPSQPTEALGAPIGYRYRVDQSIRPHPDNVNHVNSQLVEVWVCWRDEQGFVREVRTTRLLLNGII